MTKRNVLWAVSVSFIILSLVGIVYGIGKIENITLTEDRVQAMIDAKLPVSKKNITVNAVQVRLLPDVVQLSFDADGKKLRQPFHVSAQATGELMYNSLDGTFHFHPRDIKIDTLTFRGGKISGKVGGVIDRFVDSKKLVDNKEFIGNKAEEWIHSLMTSTVAATLQKIPIYKLPNNVKGNAVRMLLTSVEIGEGTITAHLSFWQLTKMIALYFLIFLTAIGILGALLMYPGLGMSALIIGSFGDT